MYRGRFSPIQHSCDAVISLDTGSQAGPLCRGSVLDGNDHHSREIEPAQLPGGQAFPPVIRDKRIACVLVADFAVAAIARANPELRERPFALTRMPTPR